MIVSDPTHEVAASNTRHRDAQENWYTIECYKNDVPPFVETALQKLYGNLFSTLAHRRVYGNARNVSTFIARTENTITCIWLYERRGRTVRVLNEGIDVNDDDTLRFARHIFATYPTVGVITFHAIQARIRTLPLPVQRNNCLEDMVLKLPASASEYLAQMGKSTRSYIHRYLNKLRRDFPTVRFTLVEAHEVDERHIQRIIDLNRARMAHKGKASINDATLASQITHLAMDCGMIGTLTIDGRLVAGTVNYRVHDNYFLEVVSHDPAYNAYRLGTLCCYLTVCECIARGGNEYHFLWGQDEYKSRLLGEQRDLDDLAVYRSRAHVLLHPATVLRHAHAAWQRRAQLWLRDARNGSGATARFAQWLSAARRRLHQA